MSKAFNLDNQRYNEIERAYEREREKNDGRRRVQGAQRAAATRNGQNGNSHSHHTLDKAHYSPLPISYDHCSTAGCVFDLDVTRNKNAMLKSDDDDHYRIGCTSSFSLLLWSALLFSRLLPLLSSFLSLSPSLSYSLSIFLFLSLTVFFECKFTFGSCKCVYAARFESTHRIKCNVTTTAEKKMW